jgi:DNA repair protein RadD
MKLTLRPYQQAAVDAVITHVKKCRSSCILDLSTGAGKSLIIADVANQIKFMSKKKVLCLAPSRELVLQNREKYLTFGFPASIFSASSGGKSTRHDVVFGSPRTVLNSIKKFSSDYAMVVIDEAHNITPTIKTIILEMKKTSPSLRVVGLTATPYRMGTGYIYGIDEHNKMMHESVARDPYFSKLLYKIGADELIHQHYLTQPITHEQHEHYDTSELEIKGGSFTSDSVNKAFVGKGRLTAEIVNKVILLTKTRKGIMFFASTIQHAEEILASLPAHDSRLITGKTKKADRIKFVNDFKLMTFKYLVSVGTLTTGFDAPHVDCIAILRATESASLLQQIIGRGLRLFDEKKDCLVLDFAQNIKRHELEDDLFQPKIQARPQKGESFFIKCLCETCGSENEFSGRENKSEFPVDENGYFTDLNDVRVEDKNEKQIPAHYGRRCTAIELINGELMQCNGRWSFKPCTECEHENDITARYCKACKAELIDPNESLQIEFAKIKRSTTTPTSDQVLGWMCEQYTSKAGNEMIRINWRTECRAFATYMQPNFKEQWIKLCDAVFNKARPATIEAYLTALRAGHGTMPKTITTSKPKGSHFFRVFAYNEDLTECTKMI